MAERSVRSILRRRQLEARVVSTAPEATVCEAAKRMAEHCCGSVLVVEGGGRAVGIFTERDLLTRVVAKGLDPSRTKVREVMTADLETIDADEPVSTAIRRMDEGCFRHLPVVDRGRVLGVISSRDIPVLDMGRMAAELDARHRLAERIW